VPNTHLQPKWRQRLVRIFLRYLNWASLMIKPIKIKYFDLFNSIVFENGGQQKDVAHPTRLRLLQFNCIFQWWATKRRCPPNPASGQLFRSLHEVDFPKLMCGFSFGKSLRSFPKQLTPNGKLFLKGARNAIRNVSTSFYIGLFTLIFLDIRHKIRVRLLWIKIIRSMYT
jgi:hypothetical protein